jgi:hypothetical protein
MTNPDFRALCAELVEELTRAANGLSNRTANDNHRALWAKDSYQAADHARAVLARWGNYPVKPDSSPANQPEPEGPTDEELWEAWGCFEHEPFSKGDTIMQLREFLARWGQP